MKLNDFLPDYLRHARANLKPKTFAEYERLLARQILPAFGTKAFSVITPQAIERWHLRLRARTPVQANRALAVLSAIFKLALRWHLVPANPCAGVSQARERARNRYLTREELQRLRVALERFSAVERTFILTALFTGARPGELAVARWEWLVEDAIELPDSKTGARIIYLSQSAREAIDALPRSGPCIFPDIEPANLWKRVRRAAKLDGVRLYDLRHSFASAGLSAGLSLEAISQLLGHRRPQTTRRYTHLVRDTGARSAARIGSVLDLM
jgi:integrase